VHVVFKYHDPSVLRAMHNKRIGRVNSSGKMVKRLPTVTSMALRYDSPVLRRSPWHTLAANAPMTSNPHVPRMKALASVSTLDTRSREQWPDFSRGASGCSTKQRLWRFSRPGFYRLHAGSRLNIV
jgi:hypothetical protein